MTGGAAAPADVLRAAVDLLAALDPSELATAEIGELCLDLQRQRHRLDAVAARLLQRWHDSGVWALDGSRSAATHLARETRSRVASCRGELRQARATTGLPAVTEAIVDGHLSIDHLDLFAAFRTPARAEAMDRDQQQLVERCRQLNFAQARTLLAYWASAHDDAQALPDDAEPDDESKVFLSETFGGSWVLDGTLDPIPGRVVHDELARLERSIADSDAAAGRKRTPAQRRAAALVEMARRSAQDPHSSRSARPLFTVLVGEQSFKHLCELAEGTVLAPQQLLPWLSTAELETILFDGPHTVVSVSHKRRFTGAVRRAIEVRDRRCTHPSDCDVPASRCDVDHIIPYSQHGPTSQFNGRLQCPTHNRNQSRHATSSSQPPSAHRSLTELDHIRGRLRYQYLNGDDADADHDTYGADVTPGSATRSAF
jgi:hypothetical protein